MMNVKLHFTHWWYNRLQF